MDEQTEQQTENKGVYIPPPNCSKKEAREGNKRHMKLGFVHKPRCGKCGHRPCMCSRITEVIPTCAACGEKKDNCKCKIIKQHYTIRLF